MPDSNRNIGLFVVTKKEQWYVNCIDGVCEVPFYREERGIVFNIGFLIAWLCPLFCVFIVNKGERCELRGCENIKRATCRRDKGPSSLSIGS